jgi:hypothetical protein
MAERFGETAAEAEAKEMLKCRQIVSEITSFGVSQRETLRIIHLLSLELEDREVMVSLADCAKRAIDGSAAPLSGLIVET